MFKSFKNLFQSNTKDISDENQPSLSTFLQNCKLFVRKTENLKSKFVTLQMYYYPWNQEEKNETVKIPYVSI